MPRTLILLAMLFAASRMHAANVGATTANDDSCDISVAPAATLLVPYFNIDVSSPPQSARTTLMSITNVSAYPQLARVTIWTDWAYPVYSFDLFLTGYGVQSLNLRDVLVDGSLPVSPIDVAPGLRSIANYANPNHLPEMPGDCALRPKSIPGAMLADMRAFLTTGRAPINNCPTRAQVGGVHRNFIGYATIDVVATCSSLTPADPAYYATELLFDNVLIGDYEDVNPDANAGNFAGGTPMVHIRAIPEGGRAGTVVATNLPYTFYDRLTTVGPAWPRTIDRRQPLPATFATRVIDGGSGNFTTNIRVWREAYTGANPSCTSYVNNSGKDIVQVIRFDEHENASVGRSGIMICTPPPGGPSGPPATSEISLARSIYSLPEVYGTNDVGGWLYINASNMGSPAYSVNGARDFKTGSSTFSNCSRGSQNWVAVSLTAEGRYSVLMDAAALANGCSISPPLDAVVEPGANVTP